MNPDFMKLWSQTDILLGAVKGLPLKQGRVTKQGIEFVFESGDQRAELRIMPKVYTAEKVIVDAINDFTLIVQVKKFERGADGNGSQFQEVLEQRIELPYSTWFDEGDYL